LINKPCVFIEIGSTEEEWKDRRAGFVVAKTIKRAIEERLSIDPIGLGKPLRYSLKGHRRLRVGDYRIVYRIDHTKHIVTIVVIKHRKDVYDE